MADRIDKLERSILALFQSACREDRLDVAEHLLRALEASSKESDDGGLPCARRPLADAYLTIARPRSKRDARRHPWISRGGDPS
ncbi:hypothetical protein [Rhizobium laguerreae]|uniref:hypothetical protein n=1 Tax=Rhizobium laguerreae TaxID=1076926 RepID=UPI001389781A|nr:hypothetical protein [Rhizobium laguerreae]NDK52791.1 hypothetical protein [Rhizobium laguerreae]